MRVPTNLASQPYENLRPWYLAAAGCTVLLVMLTTLVIWNVQRNGGQTKALTDEIARYEKDTALLRREERDLTQWLMRPEVQDIRDHSAFLNGLIVRKSLSWTQMFMDLERVLPPNVQVSAIRPSSNESTEARLNLSVAAATQAPLIEFLKNLEGSPQFEKTAVDSEKFPLERATDPNISLEMSVVYHQKAQASKTSGSEQSANRPASGGKRNDVLAQSSQARSEGSRR